MDEAERIFDLAVVGGGINGAGIACDAAGRGLSVLLLEAGDLASGTSSASSKLIHGGLRYLEHGEFRLVRAALAEREVLLRKAPHIIWPLRFVLPHVPEMRPQWLLRTGLFLYDHLHRRQTLPGSRQLSLRTQPAGRPLRADLDNAFAYWDCWVDDARLVVLNVRAAADAGACVRTRTRFLGAKADAGIWRIFVGGDDSHRGSIGARVLVNAAGPWVDRVRKTVAGLPSGEFPRIRLVKGSHIVVPRIAGADDAYVLQNDDRRIVFVLPYESRYSLIGTTDLEFAGDPGQVAPDEAEVDYLLRSVAGYFRNPPRPGEVIWKFAGVRPLVHDEHGRDASAASRDYRLDLVRADGAGKDGPPLLTVLGGKVTTYRRLAEASLDRLRPSLPKMGRAWTGEAPLPGGDVPGGDFEGFAADLVRRYDRFGAGVLLRLARRHGTLVESVIGDARTLDDMGKHLGAGLYAREVDYLARQEWARTPDDVLWRRTKAGLHLSPPERCIAAEAIGRLL